MGARRIEHAHGVAVATKVDDPSLDDLSIAILLHDAQGDGPGLLIGEIAQRSGPQPYGPTRPEAGAKGSATDDRRDRGADEGVNGDDAAG